MNTGRPVKDEVLGGEIHGLASCALPLPHHTRNLHVVPAAQETESGT